MCENQDNYQGVDTSSKSSYTMPCMGSVQTFHVGHLIPLFFPIVYVYALHTFYIVIINYTTSSLDLYCYDPE